MKMTLTVCIIADKSIDQYHRWKQTNTNKQSVLKEISLERCKLNKIIHLDKRNEKNMSRSAPAAFALDFFKTCAQR